MERIQDRALTDSLAPILFLYKKNNESYFKLRQEYDSCEKCYPLTFRAVEKGKGLKTAR